MKITPKETNVGTIFSSTFIHIPRFQRPYSWDKDNIQDFWDDIFSSNPSEYFFGSMVFYRTSESSRDAYVVDGQQRLTTVTVFFCALRDILADLGDIGLADGIQLIIERRDIDNNLKFTLNSQDPYPFFQDHIQRLGSPSTTPKIGEEERKLKECYDDLKDKIESYISDIEDSKRIQSIQSLRDKALAIKVITIDLDKEDDAYYIFETLNTRGKELGVSDLVKNLLLRLLRKDSGVDSARERWKEIQNTVGHSNSDISINSYIVHHWISKYEYLPEKKIFQSIRKRIDKESVSGYYDDLYKEVSYYRGIFEPQYLNLAKSQRKIAHSLRVFSMFRLRQAAPFALALLSEYFDKRISLKNTLECLVAIENFHLKFTAVTSQRGAGGVAMMYSKAARGLRSATTSEERVKVCRDLCSRFSDMQPGEADFILGFDEIYYSNFFASRRIIVRYMLECIHRYISPDSVVDYEKMTVEHIMSQDADEPEELKACLGNLIFVSERVNGLLENKKFPDKKKIMIENNVAVDPIIMNASQWTKKEISKRQEYLAVQGYRRIWKV